MRLVRAAVALAAVTALALLPAAALALGTPRPLAPAPAAASAFVPAFSWTAVAGAARYEFQLASDQRFQSIVVGASRPVSTVNTNATVDTSLPTGRYWWRVRAVGSAGGASAYTAGREVRIVWAPTTLTAPAEGAEVPLPAPILLDWLPTQGAAKYRIYLAADEELATPISGFPADTAADELALARHLPTTGGGAPKSYWWAIAPINAAGHVGGRSEIRSFTRSWDTSTTLTAEDLSPEPELYTPALSWTAVPGAVEYAIQVSPDPDFPLASIVCCDQATVSTRYVPTDLLPNNTYHWRVAPLDGGGNRGAWTTGPSFEKIFDLETPSIPNLRLRDSNGDPGVDIDGGTDGYQTSNPVVVWDRVPGAAGYFVELAPWNGTSCVWGSYRLRFRTATNAFTPLGPGLSAGEPYPRGGIQIAKGLGGGDIEDGQQYCVRVRAWQGTAETSTQVYSPFTYLGGGDTFSFQFIQATTGATPCTGFRLCAADYVAPATGSLDLRHAPLLVWKPVQGAQSYWVLLAKDPDFTTILDYALTNVPAYAPRKGGSAEDQLKTYADEETTLYWAVLPATAWDGLNAAPQPSPDDVATFTKRSEVPVLDVPTFESAGAPTFSWTPIIGARSYTLELRKPDGSTESIVTTGISYASFENYPNDSALSYRVRVNDAQGRGLSWSEVHELAIALPVPVRSPSNPTTGAGIPTFRWSAIQGALGYAFEAVDADGDAVRWETSIAATTPSGWTGTGAVKWRVAAKFRGTGATTVKGAQTSWGSYAKQMAAPIGAAVSRPGGGILFQWQPSAGAWKYRVEVSTDKAFASAPVESATTDGTAWAPTMTRQQYRDGGSLWFRVALRDEDGNTGAWTTPVRATLPVALRMTTAGYAKVGQRRAIDVTVTNQNGKPVKGATVTAKGPGIKARKVRTGKSGKARIWVTARQRRVRFVVTATRKGFAPAISESVVI